MSRNIARVGRRRRVLNEEIMSASALGITARGHEEDGMEPGDTPRYGAGANIENHPQVTDYVPRRYRAIALYLLGALLLVAAGELLALNAAALAAWAQVVSPEAISSQLASGLFAWTSATVLLVAACYSRLILSLRRHRVDDNRGRYRIWRWFSLASVALSLNAMMGAHALVAPVVGHFTGWSFLSGNVLWWLVPSVLCGGWLMLKLMFESRECRAALACYLLASLLLAAGGVASVWIPAWAAAYHETILRLFPVVANCLLMTGTLTFARYVVLDVQGLIEHRESAKSQAVPELAISTTDRSEEEKQQPEHCKQDTLEEAEQNTWVDGSEPEEGYEEQGNRRLSKAERKRLRKQKQRRKAA